MIVCRSFYDCMSQLFPLITKLEVKSVYSSKHVNPYKNKRIISHSKHDCTSG